MDGQADSSSSHCWDIAANEAVSYHTKKHTDTPQCEPTRSSPQALHSCEINMVLMVMLVVACYRSARHHDFYIPGGPSDGLNVETHASHAEVPISDDAVLPPPERKPCSSASRREDGVSPQQTSIVRTNTASSPGGPLWRVLAATVERARPLDHGRLFMSLACQIMATPNAVVDHTQKRQVMTRKLVQAMVRYAIRLGHNRRRGRDLSRTMLWPVPLRLHCRPQLRQSLGWALRTLATLQQWHRALDGGVSDSLRQCAEPNCIYPCNTRGSQVHQFEHDHLLSG
jgi:hypothetical protein